MINKNKTKNRKGQVTIFVIIALIIIVAIALVFVILRNQKGITTINPAENPKAYIESCLKNNLLLVEKNLIDSNFYPGMNTSFMVYAGKKVPYLCKSSQFYLPCVAQEPSLAGYLRKKIIENLNAEKCVADTINALRLGDYAVSEGSQNLSVEFTDEEIIVDLTKVISLTKDGTSQTYNKFSARIKSPIYNLAKTANMIVNYESSLCEFNIAGWARAYPDMLIKKFVASDGTKVYTLIEDNSQKQINFAVKTCVMPAGL